MPKVMVYAACWILLVYAPAGMGQIFADGFEGEDAKECRDIGGFGRSPVVFIQNRNIIAQTYEDIFGAWGASSNTAHIRLPATQYVSLPMTVTTGTANLIWDEIFASPDQLRVSVSRCRGAPVPEAAVSPDCFLQSNGRIGGFSMVNEPGPSIECVLAPGDYYFNFGWIDADGGRGCDAATCVWNVKEN